MVLLETSAIISIVGWVVSPVINMLITKVKSYLGSEYKWHKGLEKKMEKVAQFLNEIGSQVSLVEARGIHNPNMMSWLSQLRNAIREVDDIFDILDYEILKSNQNQLAVDEPAAKPGSGSIGSTELFNRINKLIEKMDGIRSSSRDIVQASTLTPRAEYSDSGSGSTSRPPTGESLPEKPLGYNDQYQRLLSGLLEDLLELKDRAVLAIVGHGGMGKTTLAQRACDDKCVRDRFDLVIWAWVYNKFTEGELLGEICRSAPVVAERSSAAPAWHGEMSFSRMQKALEELVASRRYLLVLDDVCNDERATDLKRRETWKNVLAPFRSGKCGSRVLLTTRAMVCAQVVGASASWRITLDGIDRESFICLLKRTAAFGREEAKLEEVLRSSAFSEASASAWKRSPLSAKEMGLKLRETRCRNKWAEILAADCHEDVMSAHVSSYRQLPRHLQFCFAFLSLFPNKFEFHPEMLVKMWVAHGFIGNDGSDGNTMEDAASRCFNELVSRSFLQAIKANGTVTHYVIQEQVHSMIRSVSADYFLMIQGINNSADMKIPETVLHLSVTTASLGCLALLKKHRVLRRLRTFLVLKDSSASCRSAIDKDLFRELNGVRVLDLTGTDIADLPPEIGNLIHLRYLALPDTLKVLPEEISRLHHLQAVFGSNDVQTAKVNAGKKLDLSFRFRATETGLRQLAGMNSLRGSLCITGLDAVSNEHDARKAQLRKKSSLKVLKFEWDGKDGIYPTHLDVLEGLHPPDGVRVLHIRRYRGTSSPSWLANNCLKQLTRLHLINCRKWVLLPAFGHLPLLNHLHIQEMECVERIDGSGPFISLETLVLSDMKSLVEWTAGTTDNSFTTLKRIAILGCPKLARPPPLPSTFKLLEVRSCPLLKPVLERARKEGVYQAKLDFDF